MFLLYKTDIGGYWHDLAVKMHDVVEHIPL